MTGHPVPRVDISNLPIGDELGTGGQGRVVTIGGFLVNGQWPTALKYGLKFDSDGDRDGCPVRPMLRVGRMTS